MLASLGLLLPVAALAQAPTITSMTPSTAAPGTTVTITGTNLAGFTSVLLNGLAVRATAGVVPSTTASFIIPAAAGTGKVRLTTAAGTALSGAKLGVTRASSSSNYTQLSANATNATTAGAYSTPVAADLDKDGLLELLVGQGDGTMMDYEQTGPNQPFSTTGTPITFAAGGTVDVGLYAKPTVSDLDGDGLLDLFIGNGTGTVYRYEQTQSAAVPTLTTPLPVVLTYFAGQVASTGNQLKWSTAQEVKSARFVVEASADGSTFAAIGELAAAGNSATARSYEFLDASATALSAARRYYRLRQEDLDGTTTYSPVVTLTRTAAAATAPKSLNAYPNPFAETLTVALPGAAEPQAAAVSLSTLAGRTVYATQLALGAAPQALSALPELPAGVYVLRLTTAAGTITQKVTRQ